MQTTVETELGAALSAGVEYLSKNIPENYPRDVISYSSLKEIENCPMRWKLKYIDGVRAPRTLAMSIGDAVHKGIEMFYLGESPVEAAVTRFVSEMGDLVTKDQINKSLAVVMRVVNAYVSAYPDTHHDLVESRNTVDLGNNLRIEAVTDLMYDGVIVDHKTTNKPNFEPDELQIVVNAMVLHANGHPVKHGIIRQLRRDVTGKRAAYPITIDHEVELTPDLVRESVQVIKRRLDDIDARVRMDLWSGPPLPKEEAAKMCAYGCPIPGVMVCPARA